MTADLDVDAGVHLRLGGSMARMAQDYADGAAARQAVAMAQPGVVPFTKVGIVPASWSLAIDVGGPSMGRRWMVRVASIAAAAGWTTAVAGTGQLYIGQVGSVVPQNIRWAFAALPNVANFGSDEFPLVYGEHLIAVVSGGTVGNVLIATALVQDFDPVSPLAPGWQQV